jgi:hypothetical protein
MIATPVGLPMALLKQSMTAALRQVQIPTHSGQVFRFEAGGDSDLKPATIPR